MKNIDALCARTSSHPIFFCFFLFYVYIFGNVTKCVSLWLFRLRNRRPVL